MTTTQALCACHRAPVADDAVLCDVGGDELVELLQRLTADVARGDREPRRGPDGRIERGQAGRGTSTVWDTPSGEISHLMRALDEQAARLAVRRGLVLGRTAMAEAPLPLDLRAVDAAGQVRQVVGGMAALVSGHPMPLDGYWSVPDVAAWLVGQVETVRHREDAWDLLKAVRQAIGRAERHVDVAPARHYLGVCGAIVETDVSLMNCQGQVFAVGDARVASCRSCGAQIGVPERQAQLREQADAMWLTVVEIERLTAGLGKRVPRDSINTWIRRGKLTGDGGEPARYLVADVVALADRRGKVAS